MESPFEPSRVGHRTPEVLLVEDDECINEVLCELLRDHELAATCVMTLEEARRELAKRRPDCLILDLNLPDGTGEDLLVEIAGRGPPCVLLSASRDAPRVAARFGVALVAKPFDLDHLMVTVAAAIARGIPPIEG